jgi:hypothetical protein
VYRGSEKVRIEKNVETARIVLSHSLAHRVSEF